jgi:predicted small secreted protein
MKKLSLLFVTLMSTALLAGCNTFQGFGKDLSHLGDKIQQSGNNGNNGNNGNHGNNRNSK